MVFILLYVCRMELSLDKISCMSVLIVQVVSFVVWFVVWLMLGISVAKTLLWTIQSRLPLVNGNYNCKLNQSNYCESHRMM